MSKKKAIEKIFTDLSTMYDDLNQTDQNHFKRNLKILYRIIFPKVKREPNKFMLFRAEFVKQHPELVSIDTQSKAVSIAWNKYKEKNA